MVHLPTAYEGSQLVVSHGGRSKSFDFAGASAYGMHWAAFYADCNHQVGGRAVPHGGATASANGWQLLTAAVQGRGGAAPLLALPWNLCTRPVT